MFKLLLVQRNGFGIMEAIIYSYPLYKGEDIMEYLVWVGPRDIDVKFCPIFSQSICYYSNRNTYVTRKAHIYGQFFVDFVSNEMEKIISIHTGAKFVFYNPKIAYSLPPNLREYVICLNSKFILDLLSDKIYTRYWLGNYVPVLPTVLLDAHHLSIESLKEKLGDYDSYIVQQNRSSGGFGTFCLSASDAEMLDILRTSFNELFIISPRIKNCISLNVNAVVYEDDICIFAPSLQIIQENKKRLLYHGADYKAAQMLSRHVIAKVRECAKTILKIIQRLDYRGIIGIDFILEGEQIYFQEINPRYQASSFLIDKGLKEYQLPSLTEMNINAFNNVPNISNFDSYDIHINNSFYKYLYVKEAKHLYYIEKIALQNEYVESVCFDGWNNSMQVEEDAYCYSIIFSTNITSPNMDGGYNIYSNITGEEEYLEKNLETQIGLKIALINQGCVIDENAIDFLRTQGILKKATFSAIDFRLSNGLHINAPVNLKFNDFSPFIINVAAAGVLTLKYYDIPIFNINIEMEPQWNNLVTKNGIPYGRIAYLSTDRLRIKHEPSCEFKKAGVGCGFCSIPLSKISFDDVDIEEVINYLVPEPEYRHILIGGGSGEITQEYKHVLFVANLVRNANPNLPIYLMSIPPTNVQILQKYKEAGITEVAFNIEIWDRKLAEQIMPGKGKISLETYMNTLKASTKLWGTNGNVRTALIVGLNDQNLLIEGVKTLCKNGIQPMLSVFRPMPKTKMESLVPLSNSNLLDTYLVTQDICKKYGLTLGPSCDACKNNMLAI